MANSGKKHNFCPLTGISTYVRPARLPGYLRVTPVEWEPAGPKEPGPSSDGGVSSGEGVAGTSMGPAGSADIDSGSLTVSTHGLTGAYVEEADQKESE